MPHLLSMVQSVVINFSSKVYSKSLLKGLCHVPHFRKSYLVQKYRVRYFAKVKRIDILSRSMESDILKSKKDLYLVQKYGGRYFEKVKRINILSRSTEANMFDKRIGANGYIL